MKANSPPLDPYPHTARPHTLICTWTVDVCVCVCVLIGLCAWVRVCVWVCIHGSVVVCVGVWVLV